MNRRGFLGTCLALAVAPAIVRASSLMPVVVRTPTGIWFDGVDSYLKSEAFTLDQPQSFYMLAKQMTWVSEDFAVTMNTPLPAPKVIGGFTLSAKSPAPLSSIIVRELRLEHAGKPALLFRAKDIRETPNGLEWADSNGTGIVMRGNGKLTYD